VSVSVIDTTITVWATSLYAKPQRSKNAILKFGTNQSDI